MDAVELLFYIVLFTFYSAFLSKVLIVMFCFSMEAFGGIGVVGGECSEEFKFLISIIAGSDKRLIFFFEFIAYTVIVKNFPHIGCGVLSL